MVSMFEQKESEENWTKFELALTRLTGIARGSSDLNGFSGGIKRLKTGITNCVSTERTRLARTAMLLIQELATSMGPLFENLSDILLPSVLKLTTRANKIYIQSATTTLKSAIKHAGLTSFIPTLAQEISNPSKSLRIAAIDCILQALQSNPLEKLETHVILIENIIQTSVVDSASEVRDMSRTIFDIYKDQFEHRVDRYISLTEDSSTNCLKQLGNI